MKKIVLIALGLASGFGVMAQSPNDAGVNAISSPTSPVSPGVSQPVSVTVKNYGTSPLTAATLGFSVNGVVQPAFAWTGNVAANATSAAVTIGNFTFPAGSHTIKAWSKLPNGATDGDVANDTTTIVISACTIMSGNYTINKNAVASATNFTSISAAALALGSCGVSGPVTITVAPNSGPYNEQATFPVIPGTSATNTVTFEGNGNIVTANTTSTAVGVIILNGADYVKLNNFNINLFVGVSSGSGIQLINASDNATISNCIIDVPLTVASANVVGILAGGSNNALGNFTNNSKFQNNIVKGGFYGILLQGNTGGLNAANNQITGNQVRDMYIHGIYVKNANGTLVEGNDVSRPTRIVTGEFNGIILSGATMNTVVSKNRIHNSHDASNYLTTGAYGIVNSASATPGNENIIKNNVIYKINNSGGSFYGFHIGLGTGAYYYHNTVASDPNIAYNQLRGLNFSNGAISNNIKFINNILSLASNASSNYGIYVGTGSISFISNNNNIYLGTFGSCGFYNATNYATMANWQTANSNAYDQNSVSASPGFISYATGNLKPTSPVINNLGQPLTTVTDDFLGTLRHATTPDVGAYEFSIQPNDVGVFGISGPNITGCGFSATETITVTIKNFGAATQTSVPVSFAVDGVAIAAPETFTGSIAPNGTASYTFTAKANLATSGPRVITAKTLLAGDIITNNDADTLSLTNSFIPGLPVTFNFETPASDISRMRQVVNPKSKIGLSPVASNGTGSTKGMIMDGVKHPAWLTPATPADTWTSNPDNFAAVYFCVSTTGTAATDSLFLTFDLKQLYQLNNANTNLSVTVNTAHIGPTYRSATSGLGGTWRKIKVDLTPFINTPTLVIGLESSVSESYANGAGAANLIDNIEIKRVAGTTGTTGVKNNLLQSQVNVYPNPSNGIFNIDLPKGKAYEVVVSDLSGKVIMRNQANGNAQLNLEGTAKGIYLLKVSGDNGSAVRKLIVE